MVDHLFLSVGVAFVFRMGNFAISYSCIAPSPLRCGVGACGTLRGGGCGLPLCTLLFGSGALLKGLGCLTEAVLSRDGCLLPYVGGFG